MSLYYYLILSEVVLTSPLMLSGREQAVKVCLHVAPRSGALLDDIRAAAVSWEMTHESRQ